MATNERRGTPGRLLMAWSYMLVVCVLFAWRVKVNRITTPPENGYEVPIYPTALGDTRYYQPIGTDDFYKPNIVSAALPSGLYRMMHKPVPRDDARMIKADLYASGTGPVLYREDKHRRADDDSPLPSRYFLKTGENRYLEFGKQRYWPHYEAPRAIPYTPPATAPR